MSKGGEEGRGKSVAPQQTECKIKKSLATSTALRTILSLSVPALFNITAFFFILPLFTIPPPPFATLCAFVSVATNDSCSSSFACAVVVCKLLMKSAQSPNVVSSNATSHSYLTVSLPSTPVRLPLHAAVSLT